MAVIVGDDWTVVPTEDERPTTPPRERRYPPQRVPREGEDGRLPDRLGHWDEVKVEWL